MAQWKPTSVDDNFVEADAGMRAAEGANLAVREQFDRQLIDCLPTLACSCNAEGQCDYVNARWSQYTGWPAERFMGSGWLEALHASDRDAVAETWRRSVREGDGFRAEFRMRRRDGGYRWFEMTATALRDGAGKVIKWFGASADIDDRHRDEQRLRRLYESNLVGIAFWTRNGTILSANDALLSMLGYTREEFETSGLNWRANTPREWSTVDEEQMRALDAVGRCGPFEKEYFRKDGSRVPVIVSRADLEPGDHSHGIAFIVDLSRPKQVEAELRASQAALRQLNESLEARVRERTEEVQLRSEQLRALALDLTETESRERKRLAQVLHDHFQQLVSAAKLKAGIVRRRLGESPLIESVRQIEALLDDAISASRSLATELSPPVLHDAGLAAALEWLVRRVKSDHNLTVELSVEPNCEPDNEQVRVILFECVRELLFNIVKHSGVNEASVTLSHLHEGLLLVKVRDEGKGFDTSRMNMVRKPDGSFGLFSIRERLGLIGGLLNVRSNEGHGTSAEMTVPTTFRIESNRVNDLPQASAGDRFETAGSVGWTTESGPSLNEAVASQASIAAVSTPVSVLVADDHRLFREGLISLIAQEPCINVVGQAADGIEAIEMARKLKPDVMIVDVTMPKLNGIQVATLITKELPQTRIIGLSMHERADMAQAMRQAGAIAYCTKGGPTDALLNVLREVAAKSAPRAAE